MSSNITLRNKTVQVNKFITLSQTKLLINITDNKHCLFQNMSFMVNPYMLSLSVTSIH